MDASKCLEWFCLCLEMSGLECFGLVLFMNFDACVTGHRVLASDKTYMTLSSGNETKLCVMQTLLDWYQRRTHLHNLTWLLRMFLQLAITHTARTGRKLT